jgi:hypothetical protein
MSQFCALVVEQAITFLDNLARLDSSASSGISTRELFERKSLILPNSVIGRHLRYFLSGNSCFFWFCKGGLGVNGRHVEGRIAKVLDASERQQDPEPLSYEGGKRIVFPSLPPSLRVPESLLTGLLGILHIALNRNIPSRLYRPPKQTDSIP